MTIPRRRALIIDDDPVTRAVAGEVLAAAGWQVFEAADGREALAWLADAPADLALVDVLMPNMDGLEAIPEIRRRWPELRIIAMSGGGGRLEPSTLLKTSRVLGAHGALMKPLHPVALRAMADEVLALGRPTPAAGA